jgi:hypothetical protein
VPLVLAKDHSCMDREQVQVWCPHKGSALSEDLVGLMLLLKEFVMVANIEEFRSEIIVEWPFLAEFVAAV